MDDLSTNIRNLRFSKNVTQQELATALRVSQNKISYFERGVEWPKKKNLEDMALFFDISVDELLGRANIFDDPDYNEFTILIKRILFELDETERHMLKVIIKSVLDNRKIK